MTTLESRLARLEAIEEIRCLKARYADACDSGYDPDRMLAIFTADAVWDGSPRFGRHDGIDAICAFFRGASSQITWALHYMIAPVIDVAPDGLSATGTWYLWQPCTMVGETGPQAVWLTGRYADRYRREPDGWRIAELVLDCQCVTPFEEGWVTRPFWNEERRQA